MGLAFIKKRKRTMKNVFIQNDQANNGCMREGDCLWL